jgi:hypothetical protein
MLMLPVSESENLKAGGASLTAAELSVNTVLVSCKIADKEV